MLTTSTSTAVSTAFEICKSSTFKTEEQMYLGERVLRSLEQELLIVSNLTPANMSKDELTDLKEQYSRELALIRHTVLDEELLIAKLLLHMSGKTDCGYTHEIDRTTLQKKSKDSFIAYCSKCHTSRRLVLLLRDIRPTVRIEMKFLGQILMSLQGLMQANESNDQKEEDNLAQMTWDDFLNE